MHSRILQEILHSVADNSTKDRYFLLRKTSDDPAMIDVKQRTISLFVFQGNLSILINDRIVRNLPVIRDKSFSVLRF